MQVLYSDERVADQVRSLNRQRAQALVRAHASIVNGDFDSATEYFFLADQLGDQTVDACTLPDEDVNCDAVCESPQREYVLDEWEIMKALTDLFKHASDTEAVRILDWARDRFVVSGS